MTCPSQAVFRGLPYHWPENLRSQLQSQVPSLLCVCQLLSYPIYISQSCPAFVPPPPATGCSLPSPSVPPAWASDHPALLLASSSRLCRPHRRRLQRGCPLGGVVFSPRHHLQSLPLLSSCDIPALPAFPIFLPHILCMLEAAYRPLTAVAHSFPAPPPSASCLMASIAWPLISFTCSSSSCFPTFLTFLSWAGSCSECAHLW